MPADLLAGLRKAVAGRVIGPDDHGWEQARRGWNLYVDQRPSAVVEVAGVADIAAAVRFAAEHRLPVTTQPRGHGATKALAGAILLRPTALDGLHLDLDRRLARVEAGVRWQRLNRALTGTGLTSLPGSTGDTSVAGYTLGGGMSWFSRMYGLAAHRVRAVELVTPDGEEVRVTGANDPDLFWALRGCGGEFGVVTALELDLLPLSYLHGGRLLWPATNARQVLSAYLEMTAAAPDGLTVWAWLLNLPDLDLVPASLRGRWAVALDLTYLAEGREGEPHHRPLWPDPLGWTDTIQASTVAGRALEPLRRLPAPAAGALGPVPLSELGTIAAEPTEPMPVMDGAMLLDRFDGAALDALLQAVQPGQPSPLAIVEIRHLGGAVAAVPERPGPIGAVPEPYALIMGGPVFQPEQAGELADALARVEAALAGFGSGRLPPNFGDDPAAIYPPAALERLRRLKRDRDPYQLIRSNRPLLSAG
jgi:hypothetical protein